jgi:hypothetical protein
MLFTNHAIWFKRDSRGIPVAKELFAATKLYGYSAGRGLLYTLPTVMNKSRAKHHVGRLDNDTEPLLVVYDIDDWTYEVELTVNPVIENEFAVLGNPLK